MSMYSLLCIRVTNFFGTGGEFQFGQNIKGPPDSLAPAVCGFSCPAPGCVLAGRVNSGLELLLLVENSGMCTRALESVHVAPA